MHRYGWLLLAIFTVLLLSPLLESEHGWGGWILPLAFTAVYVVGLLANRSRPIVFKTGIGVAVLVLILTWVDSAVESETVAIAHNISGAVYLLFLAALILFNVLSKHVASVESVLGAMCVYFLLGLSWATMYRSAELIETNPLNIAHREVELKEGDSQLTRFSQLIYFSFVTMSTLGYGDITPTTPLSRTLCWTEAVVGQFYIAVLVAWLVSALPRPGSKNENDSPLDAGA